MAKNKKRMPMMAYVAIILAGCVFAFSNIITNDYLKLFVVIFVLAVGLYGVMKTLSNNPESESEIDEEIN